MAAQGPTTAACVGGTETLRTTTSHQLSKFAGCHQTRPVFGSPLIQSLTPTLSHYNTLFGLRAFVEASGATMLLYDLPSLAKQHRVVNEYSSPIFSGLTKELLLKADYSCRKLDPRLTSCNIAIATHLSALTSASRFGSHHGTKSLQTVLHSVLPHKTAPGILTPVLRVADLGEVEQGTEGDSMDQAALRNATELLDLRSTALNSYAVPARLPQSAASSGEWNAAACLVGARAPIVAQISSSRSDTTPLPSTFTTCQRELVWGGSTEFHIAAGVVHSEHYTRHLLQQTIDSVAGTRGNEGGNSSCSTKMGAFVHHLTSSNEEWVDDSKDILRAKIGEDLTTM